MSSDLTQAASSRYHRLQSRGKRKDKNGIINKKVQTLSPSNPYVMGSTNMKKSTPHTKISEKNGYSFPAPTKMTIDLDHLSEDMRRKMASLLEHRRVDENEAVAMPSSDRNVSHSRSRYQLQTISLIQESFSGKKIKEVVRSSSREAR